MTSFVESCGILLDLSPFFARAATFVNPSERGRMVAKIAETTVHRKNPLLELDLEIFSSRKDSATKSSHWM